MKTGILFAIALLWGGYAKAEKLSVVAASDLKFCLDLLVDQYEKAHPGSTIQVTYGSSGKAFSQIQQGAPYDVYFSADVEYPNKLAAAGKTASTPKLYAIGRLVLWSAKEDASKLRLPSLMDARFHKIAIANPTHAPYGKKAEEVLRNAKLWDSLQPRLVLGENISQAAQFVQSGSAPIGILALSLVKSPAFAGQRYYLIPSQYHTPLEQAVVILKRAESNPLATDFVKYIFTPPARKIFETYGFTLPGP
jgi:molybdate transport system substrate-binding protein